MTDIEQKALALVNEVRSERGYAPIDHLYRTNFESEALCRAIEQHEAFRQEVSDVVWGYYGGTHIPRTSMFAKFIIPKPDPLVEALDSLGLRKADEWAGDIRKALAARGLEIRGKNDDQNRT